jgi:hypothetical protein
MYPAGNTELRPIATIVKQEHDQGNFAGCHIIVTVPTYHVEPSKEQEYNQPPESEDDSFPMGDVSSVPELQSIGPERYACITMLLEVHTLPVVVPEFKTRVLRLQKDFSNNYYGGSQLFSRPENPPLDDNRVGLCMYIRCEKNNAYMHMFRTRKEKNANIPTEKVYPEIINIVKDKKNATKIFELLGKYNKAADNKKIQPFSTCLTKWKERWNKKTQGRLLLRGNLTGWSVPNTDYKLSVDLSRVDNAQLKNHGQYAGQFAFCIPYMGRLLLKQERSSDFIRSVRQAKWSEEPIQHSSYYRILRRSNQVYSVTRDIHVPGPYCIPLPVCL